MCLSAFLPNRFVFFWPETYWKKNILFQVKHSIIHSKEKRSMFYGNFQDLVLPKIWTIKKQPMNNKKEEEGS